MIVKDQATGCSRLEGSVTMGSARALLAEGAKLFNSSPVTLDLSGVEAVDSSAVSLLLEWLREARRQGREIRFLNPPENLKSLISLYGVGALIPAVG